jgi:hypothetical protein
MQIAILIAAMIVGILIIRRLMFAVSGTPPINPERDRRAGFGAGEAFHAVSILPVETGCPAVESIKVQRFLSEDAPGLPLADCSAVDCHCKYIHHADRRSGGRDRRLGAIESDAAEFWSLRSRRIAVGRRHEDLQVA